MGGRVRSALVGVALAGIVVGMTAKPASATVSGPCTAQLGSVDVTSGHDTPGSAVRADQATPIRYAGRTTSGQSVDDLVLRLEILGSGYQPTTASTNGPTWSDTVDISKYAWAGVGLYHVTGTALSGGAPICSGSFYLCVTGRSPVQTVAGGVALALGAVALFLLARGLALRRRRSRARLATRFGGVGVLAGVAAPILLQQTCTAALTPTLAAASVGGGLVVLAALGAALARAVDRPGPGSFTPPAPAPPPAPEPEPERHDERAAVYRFVAAEGACAACRGHATHRLYRTRAAAEANRAHLGCHCPIQEGMAPRAEVVGRFAGRDVVDDRHA